MSLTSWFLVSGGGTRHRLPREMIFVGRDDCELMLQSRSVDKQHAVINYEPNTDEHKVKDLGSLNGTFVNDVRMQEQMYITLKMDDKLRFGYDLHTNLFTVVRGKLHVPEEALKHEKFTSQLQLSQKMPPDGEPSKAPEHKPTEGAAASEGATAKAAEASKEDKMAADAAALKRGTPLYGQPAWWGDGDADDEHSGKQEGRAERNQEKPETDAKKNAEAKENSARSQERSYFEIPSKAGGKGSGQGASRDSETVAANSEGTLGHASFTIKFDPGAPGKGTVKDNMPKLAPETRPRPKRGAGEELSPLQTAMVAAEVKVADWLAQNELPLALKETVAEEDGESVKSDVPVQQRSLKGSKHEDGTQSDSENALAEQRRAAALEEHSRGLWGRRLDPGVKIREGRANVPEGLFAEEDSPARRHRSSASKLAPLGGELREKRGGSAPFRQTGQEDDQSDRGTYTIELENGDHEEEEARRMIDKVFGVEEHQSVHRMGYPDLKRDRKITQRPSSGDRGKAGRLEPEALAEELEVGGPRWVSQWATLAASHIRTDPEGSGGESQVYATEDRAEISESSHSSYKERKRRTLPQLPSEELALGRRAAGTVGDKQDTELQEKENQEKLSRGNAKPACRAGGGSQGGSPKRSSPAKSQDNGRRSGQPGVCAEAPPHPISSGEKRLEEVQRRKKEEEKARESAGKPLLRQESFTVERRNTPQAVELRPRIESKAQAVDPGTLQKDSEAVAAFLETTVSDQGDPPSQSIEGSMSPESDVDTTSTVSQAGHTGGRKVVQKRRALAAQQKERTSVCSSSKGPTGTRTGQERKAKGRPSGGQASQPWTSQDLTDDDVNSNSLFSDSRPSSSQEVRPPARAQTGSTTVGASTKASRAKCTQPLAPASTTGSSKATTVPRPRPTRSSLLRRARLGDSSDTEMGDLDRMSVASEASTASSTSRTGKALRGLSRIEALSQPRRPRVGSPSARSDSEATSSRNLPGNVSFRQLYRSLKYASSLTTTR
ncbi:LOW QUALITY PROTEIN: centrosomal protein of 170 kDa-like [Aplochiton taeniatus]